MRWREIFENDVEQRRDMMRKEPVKNGYYTMYRACKTTATDFYPMDYVSLNKRFAIEHCEHMTAVEGEEYHVIRALATNDDNKTMLYHAPNTGEYFYDGDAPKKGKVTYVAKGDDYEIE